MGSPLRPLSRVTHLLPGDLATRRDRDRSYLMRLKTGNLLLPHYLEAGLLRVNHRLDETHGGWDAPQSEIRGTVAGHWLSAAARIYDETGDVELKARADVMVSEIGRCQAENGGEWCFPIPEKYLHWLRRGKRVWAPHYVCHKTMMGLLDMHRYAGSAEALEIARRAARWFTRFSKETTREQLSEMMSIEETGGIMEYWADLYSVTGDPEHLELVRRYERPELFEPLARGEDVLTNMHANMTIPEVHGAAKAWEVTGEGRYRRIVENYWDLAVRRRGTFATGGQTSGEIWTPMGRQASRLGPLTQEHCTVYNMMRLAEYLLRWTGRSEFADYWERNLYNGILAQGFWEGSSMSMLAEPYDPPRGVVSYFLPLAAGSSKKWGSETEDFWCCHCTAVQANANHREGIYYGQGEDEILVCQYLPSRTAFEVRETRVEVSQSFDNQAGDILRILPVSREVLRRPNEVRVALRIKAERPIELTVKLRVPWWLAGKPRVLSAGSELRWEQDGNGFAAIRRLWKDDELTVVLPKDLRSWPLPDRPGTVAFLDGPVVLAGLVSEERLLYGDPAEPTTMLEPDDERHWATWMGGWHTVNQPVGWRFRPIHEIGRETYTVYFPVQPADHPTRSAP